MNVVYIYADTPQEWNCSEHNCLIPTRAINATGKHKATAIFLNDFTSNTEECQKACSEADIIVVERNFFGDTLTMMQFWKVRNKTVIAIFDDAYDIMHPKNVSHNFWTYGEIKYKSEGSDEEKIGHMSPPPIEQFKWGLKIAKGVQVPSVNLAKDWSKYNNTYYVHNFLEIDKYMNVEPLFPHDDRIVIGWCGSLSHFASFNDSGIAVGLEKVCRKFPNVHVLISGDKRVFDLLDVKNKVFQPFVPADQWCPLVKTLDIGLAPLAGEYDKRRSWIKTLEYMALKIPWVATDYPTYDELKDYGSLTQNGYKYWEHALIDMIENYKTYKEKAETVGYEFALSQSSALNIEPVTLALYQKLIDSPYPL